MSKSTTRSRTATTQAREDKTKATTTKSTMTKPSGPKARGAKARGAKARGAKAQATATRKPANRAKDDRVGAAGNVTGGTPSRRPDTKQARLIAMLEREEGASIAEIAAAFSWQAHTVRGAIAGALKKKLGLAITSTKVEGRGRVYRIAAG